MTAVCYKSGVHTDKKYRHSNIIFSLFVSTIEIPPSLC